MKDVDDNDEYSSYLGCPTALGNLLFFYHKATDYVTELWMSDGTEAGTIETDFTANFLECSVVMHDKLYFYGNDGTNNEYGGELYRCNPSYSAPLVPTVMYLLD